MSQRIDVKSIYQKLVQRRGRFTWTLSIIMLVAYFGYIALVAFDKSLLARPIGGGVTSLGIPVGVGLILLAILLTGLYVRRANKEYDPLVDALRQAGVRQSLERRRTRMENAVSAHDVQLRRRARSDMGSL